MRATLKPRLKKGQKATKQVCCHRCGGPTRLIRFSKDDRVYWCQKDGELMVMKDGIFRHYETFR